MQKGFLAMLLAAIVAAACGAPTASAQTPGAAAPSPQDRVNAYRARWMRFMDHPDQASGDGAWQTAAMLGREDMFTQLYDILRRNKPSLQGQTVCGAVVSGDPIAEIVRRARQTNIVVISEYHGDPRHRAFAARVVQALRSEGYSIFAAETLFNGVDHSSPNALLTDGYYTEEPTFGTELALAKRLGYRVVPYEITDAQAMTSKTSDDRERMQAENLMSAILQTSREAKVLIHAGGARERSNSGDDYHHMVEHLKRLSGIDPLTINQTDCVSATASVVLAAGFETPAPTLSDLFVGQPPLTFKDGRPAWRQEAGQKPASVPAQFLAAKEPIIVEARPADVSLQVVPTDRLYLRPGETLPLLLPSGQYRVDAWTASGPLNGEPQLLAVK
jgi:hypothetical protein